MDTTGLPHGYLTIRWTYGEQPPEDQWPSLEVKKVTFEQIEAHFPPDAPRMSLEERERAILVRHRHVQRRYRQY